MGGSYGPSLKFFGTDMQGQFFGSENGSNCTCFREEFYYAWNQSEVNIPFDNNAVLLSALSYTIKTGGDFWMLFEGEAFVTHSPFSELNVIFYFEIRVNGVVQKTTLKQLELDKIDPLTYPDILTRSQVEDYAVTYMQTLKAGDVVDFSVRAVVANNYQTPAILTGLIQDSTITLEKKKI